MILHHSDASAPTLNGQDGSLYNVLKWALPQLGWTIAHDDAVNFRIAFKNSGLGTGYHLQVKDQAADHSQDSRQARVQGFATMTDIDTGTGAWMDATEYRWPKSDTANATAIDWTIIGDDRSFYFLPRTGQQQGISINNRGRALLFAGDFISYKPDDAGGFAIFTSNVTTWALRQLLGVASIASQSLNTSGLEQQTLMPDALATSSDGLSTGQDVHLIGKAGSPSVSASRFMGYIGPSNPDPISGGINTTIIELWETSASARRGRLPGLLAPLHEIGSSLTQLQTVSAPTSKGVANAIAVEYSPVTLPGSIGLSRLGWALFETGNWW